MGEYCRKEASLERPIIPTIKINEPPKVDPRKPKAFCVWFSRSVPSPRLEYSTFPYRRGQAIGNTAEWGPLDLPKFKSPLLFMSSTSLVLGGDEDKGFAAVWTSSNTCLMARNGKQPLTLTPAMLKMLLRQLTSPMFHASYLTTAPSSLR